MSSSALRFALFGILTSLIGAQELNLRPVQDSHTKSFGSAIVLTCSMAEGEIKWFDSQSNEITERAGRLYIENDNAQTLKLYITNISKDDAGKYTCQGKMGDTELKKDVTLFLFEEITFGAFPLTQNPKIYEDALVLCTVNGMPAPKVSWRHDGQRLVEDSRYSVGNSSGLIIRNITEADNGVYVCRGEVEADGRYKEELITVKVHIPPKITQPLESLEVVQDAAASLSCEASGLPQPSFEFFKDDDDVPLVSTGTMSVSSEGGSLSFTSVKKSDDGNYTCKAVNRVGSDSAAGQLRVLVKPSISQFADVVGVKGNESSIVCIADGDPLPSLTFYREGSAEEYQQGTSGDERYTVSSSQPGQLQLTLHRLRLEDAGKYACNATSKIGSDVKTADVMVQFEPSFATGTEIVYNWAGKTQNLTCEPSGEPTPGTVWMHSNVVLENNDTFQIFHLERQSVLQVTVKELDQSWIYGPYLCEATNLLGKATKEIEMRRATTPDSPEHVEVTKRLPTTIVLEVKPPADDGGVAVTGYSVDYSVKVVKVATVVVDDAMSFEVNQTGSPESPESPEGPETTDPSTVPAIMTAESSENIIRIENLAANTTFLFKVRARNDVGSGNPFELTDSTVAFTEPGPVIINSKDRSSDPFEYTVTWEKPSTDGRPVKQYQFSYRRVMFNKHSQTVEEIPGVDWTSVTAIGQNLLYTIKDLTPNSYYQLKTRAQNEIGWSQPGKEFLFSTIEVYDDVAGTSSQQAGAGAGVVVGVVLVVFIIFLVIVDVSCYFINSCGVTSFLCLRICKRTQSKEKAMEEGERTRLHQVPEEKDEDFKELLKDKIELEDPKVVDGDDDKKAETTEAV